MARREVVLIGGGHAHVQVLRRLAMAPLPRARVTVVLDRPVAVYSGMVPGVVAGEYTPDEPALDIHPLARAAGATVVVAAATRIDAAARRVHLEGRPPLRWDVCSVNVGATVAGADRPGVAEHALSTRPIGAFVARLDEVFPAGAPPRRVLVVGGGAGGVEVALGLRRRLGPEARITLLEAGPRILPGARDRLARRVEQAAEARDVLVRTGAPATRAEEDHLVLEGGERLPFDVLVWVAGAAPPAVVRASDLPKEARGFLLVDRHLRVRGHDDLFAAGDCAVPDEARWVPRAGVHAVRQGAVLADNLEAHLRGWRLRRYRPQRDFLSLLNLGDGRALGAKWGFVAEGRWVHRLKDRIDRRFVARFQVLDAEGRPTAAAPPPVHCSQLGKAPRDVDVDVVGLRRAAGAGASGSDRRGRRSYCVFPMSSAPWRLGGLARALRDQADVYDRQAPPPKAPDMGRGGCAAEAAPRALDEALARLGAPGDPSAVRGLPERQDVAAVRPDGADVVVTSVGALRAFSDDAWLVGRVAAADALGDLHARAVAPRRALALVAVPDEVVEAGDDAVADLVHQVLAGARAALDADGVTLVGGHTTTARDLLVGFTVLGQADAPEALLPLSGLRPGHALVLTRALGTGALLRADARGLVRGPWHQAAVRSMARSHAAAVAVMREAGAAAATRVGASGLAGHLAAMLRAGGVAARLDLHALPALPGALSLLARGERSAAQHRNAGVLTTARLPADGAGDPAVALLVDPQTAGGLLFGVAAEHADEAVARLREAGEDAAAVVGHVVAAEPGDPLLEVRRSR